MKIKIIEGIDSLEEIFRKTKIMILKNSQRCPISRTAKREFEKFAEEYNDRIDLYMVDVIKCRDISNEIAEKTGVKHESPQIFLVENGEVTWHASHWNIKSETLHDIMNS